MTDLLGRVADAGFAVELNGDAPQLVRIHADAVMPADLMAELRANRDAVVGHLRAFACKGCGRQRDAKLRCWTCGTRPCGACGKTTSSVLIATCDVCGAREG